MSMNSKMAMRRRKAILVVALIVIIIVACFIFMIVGIASRGKKSNSVAIATIEPTATIGNILNTPIPDDTEDETLAASATATASSGTVMYVTGDSVNVRKEASASSDKLTSLSKGTAVTALKQEGDFWQVNLSDGTTGYISAKYLSSSASSASSSSATATPSAASATPDTSDGKTMYVTGDSVNVRKTASSDGERITRVSKGTKVTAYTTSNGWTYVMYATNKYGYISSSLLTTSAPATATPTAVPETTVTPTPTAEHATSFEQIGIPTEIANGIENKDTWLSMTKVVSATSGTHGDFGYYEVEKLDGNVYYIGYKGSAGSYTSIQVVSKLSALK